MRPLAPLLAAALAASAVAACGHTTERTVVVTPSPGSTVVVPRDGEPQVIPPR